jgi:outer membrane protein assembly factor BamE
MIRRSLLPILAAALLGACMPVHRMDVQQGNVVTQEMVSKLQKGMSREQVRFALGTPLITDPFHPNRWDYVYRFSRRGRLEEQRLLTVVFENDRLARVEGDVVPAGERPGSLQR